MRAHVLLLGLTLFQSSLTLHPVTVCAATPARPVAASTKAHPAKPPAVTQRATYWRPALAVMPFTDRTEGAWLLWTGRDVGEGLASWVADSLARTDHWRLPDSAKVGGAFASRRREELLSDANAIALGSSFGAELALTGVITTFTVKETQPHPDQLRWGLGNGRRRTTATVVLEMRLLDCATGSVVQTAVLKREQTSQSSSTVGGGDRLERADFEGTPLGLASGEVVSAVVQLLEDEAVSRASVRVSRVAANAVWLDAGRARGLAAGQRLVVMRPDLVTMDPEAGNMTTNTERVVAELLVTGFADGAARSAKCRIQRGRAEPGDVVRLLSEVTGRSARSAVGTVAR